MCVCVGVMKYHYMCVCVCNEVPLHYLNYRGIVTLLAIIPIHIHVLKGEYICRDNRDKSLHLWLHINPNLEMFYLSVCLSLCLSVSLSLCVS